MAELDIVSREVHPTPKVLMLELEGGVDDKSYPKLERALKRTFKDGCCRLILNFANLRFLNEADKLLRYEKAFRKKGGGIVLYEVPARVKVKLQTLELDTKIKLHSSLKAAIAELSAGASVVSEIITDSGEMEAVTDEPPKPTRKKKRKPKPEPVSEVEDAEDAAEPPTPKRKTTRKKTARKKPPVVDEVEDDEDEDEPPKARKSTSRRRKKADADEDGPSKRGATGRSKRGQTGRRRRPKGDDGDAPKKGGKLWIYLIEAVVVIGAAAAYFLTRG